MSEYDLREMLLSGRAPGNIRLLMAQGAIPLPAQETLELLVRLSRDDDEEISKCAVKTLEGWNESEILALLRLKECHAVILDFFADTRRSEHILQAIAANPSASGETIARLAADADSALLDAILDNRKRILEFPAILENIRRNPSANARILGLIQEIETEFLGEKRKDYSIDSAGEAEAGAENVLDVPQDILDFEAEIAMLLSSPPPEINLSLEGLPLESDVDDANIVVRIASMPAKEKIRYALFGTREIRAILIRDTNREVARAVLRSPKLKENEVEGISAMRSVSEDVLREIGTGREWLKNSIIVHNLLKNPKTPPMIAQRLMPRLRIQELVLMTRDRSLPDATRNNAQRLIKQRAARGSAR
ncbi:MAG: hypothetical protein FWF13_01315 [Acidobacteria bacterium]|nr:hypothetical protein [Acidobacteriota bacterium]